MTGRAYVTGAGGFLGRHVVAELERRGYAVTRLRFAFCAPGEEPTVLIDGGEQSFERLRRLFAESPPTAVLHLAGTTRPPLMADVNAGLATRLIDVLAAAHPSPRLVLVGSAAEYGQVADADLPVVETYPCRPLSPYGETKHAQTLHGLAAAERGLDVVVARCFNLVGAGMPHDAPLMEIASRLHVSPPPSAISVGDLDIERDFVDVGDAARCLIGLAETPKARGKVVNVCSGQGVLMRDVVQRFVEEVTPRPSLVPDPSLTRAQTVRRMVGHPGRLNALGLSARAPDFAALARTLLQDG